MRMEVWGRWRDKRERRGSIEEKTGVWGTLTQREGSRASLRCSFDLGQELREQEQARVGLMEALLEKRSKGLHSDGVDEVARARKHGLRARNRDSARRRRRSRVVEQPKMFDVQVPQKTVK